MDGFMELNEDLNKSLEAECSSGETLLANNEKLRAENEYLKECNNNQAKMILNYTGVPKFDYKLPNEPFWRITWKQ